MSSKLLGFIKWWLRCLNQNVAKASWSQCTCEDISNACLHLSHLGLFTSPSLNKCPFKQQRPVSNLVTILSWFLLRLSISPALYAEGFLRKLLACLCPRMDCKRFSCFLLIQTWQPLHIYQVQAQVLWRNVRRLLWLNWSAVSFPSIPVCPGTLTSWILLHFASFTSDWWQSQTNLEFIWKL